MNRYEALSRKFQNCETVIGTQMTMVTSTLMLEAMDRPELDYMLFDNEHGTYNNEQLVSLLQVCRLLGLPSLVRVPNSEYSYISRAVNLGADGIMLPRTETVEQVETAIGAMRFHPIGKTGFGGFQRFRKGETMEEYQKSRYLIIQIESPVGIANLPEMLEKHGDQIASVIVGPFDLSVMNGTPAVIDSPQNLAAIQQVFGICKQYGKSCGIFCPNYEKAKLFQEMGAQVLWFSAEIDFLTRGYNETLSEILTLV